MSWKEIISIMHVEPNALKWAERATWSGWSWMVVVVFIPLVIGMVIGIVWILRALLIKSRDQPQTEAPGSAVPKSNPSDAPAGQLLDAAKLRIVGMAWVLSLMAGFALVWVWFYTRDPNNLLRDLGVSSVWELSPQGVTALLDRLRILAWTQILLAAAGLMWLVVALGFKVETQEKTQPRNHIEPEPPSVPGKVARETAPDRTVDLEPLRPPEPSKESVSPEEAVIAIQEETTQPSPFPPTEERGQPPLVVTPPSEPEPLPKPEEEKPLFYLRLRSTDPSFYPGGIYLDGVLWRVGEHRHFRSARLYVSPDGRHIRTKKRGKCVILRYESAERCLKGYSSGSEVETQEVRFDVPTGQPPPSARQAVYDGEHFYVARTRLQFLLSIPSEEDKVYEKK